MNLIKRFYDATKHLNPKILIRVTGDNPFTSSEITDYMIKKHLSTKADFTYMNKKNLPVGVCPEIISFKAIKKLLIQKINFNYSEYVMYYFINNSKFFNNSTLDDHLNIIKHRYRDCKIGKKSLNMTMSQLKHIPSR